jgi:hypothetical protein
VGRATGAGCRLLDADDDEVDGLAAGILGLVLHAAADERDVGLAILPSS